MCVSSELRKIQELKRNKMELSSETKELVEIFSGKGFEIHEGYALTEKNAKEIKWGQYSGCYYLAKEMRNYLLVKTEKGYRLSVHCGGGDDSKGRTLPACYQPLLENVNIEELRSGVF